jgi:hypothetical protein
LLVPVTLGTALDPGRRHEQSEGER